MSAIALIPPRPRRALAHIAVVTRRNLLANIRLPDVLVLSTVQPVTFMLLFLYVFGGAIQNTLPAAAGGRYINWLVPGILAQSAVFGAAPTAFGLNADRASGVIDRFRSLPMARSAVLAGRTTADLIRNAGVLALQLAAGFALGFRWHTSAWALLAGLGVALAFGYACSWIMAALGWPSAAPRRSRPPSTWSCSR
jgi:ABC-2 type transporter